MKNFLSLGLLLLLVSGFALAQDTRTKIEELNDKFSDALIKGQPDMLSDIYSDDVISLPSYAPMSKGKQELLSTMKKDFEKGTKITKADFTTLEIIEEGNIIIEIGSYEMEVDMADSEENFSDKGKYVTVWEKKGNDLKVLVETWNTDTNPWTMMNQSEEQQKDSLE